MRHNVSGRKLNRAPAHRKMLYRNLVTALLKHERITTTVQKAKEARSVAERLISRAKNDDLHSRRQAARKINEPDVLKKLFEEIGPRYAERPGGYTRILRLGFRRGDNAELAILELIDSTAPRKVVDSARRSRARRILKAEEKAEEKAALMEAAGEPVPEEIEETEETEDVVEEAAPVEEKVDEPTDEAPAEADAADDEEEEKKD